MVPKVNNCRTYIFIGLVLKKRESWKKDVLEKKRYQSNLKNLNLNLILTLNWMKY